MTPEQKSTFREKGYLLLRGALDKRQVGPIRDYVLSELKRLRIWSSGKTLSASIKQTPPFQQITKLSGLIKRDDLQSKLITRDILSAINSLAEVKLIPAQSQFLISLPNQGVWTINGLNWHTDISHNTTGIQAFILIDEVKPSGGATLAIAGSHLLPRQRLREILQQNDDLQSVLRSNNLSLVEMSGQAGDVYLMDMRLLHTPSINATKNVRMVATVRYLSTR
ncbi:MAG TPA: phytanoyl-CoA dioxygenase family protein [Pyrinomonadaceae bacterium]|nr:phytanoyl-CoA dioxygenase family protein [Pyrinomonadaceae bacterium]